MTDKIFEKFMKIANSTEKSKGREYANNKDITNLVFGKDEKFITIFADIEGTSIYDAEIIYNIETGIFMAECSCPANGEYSKQCKHIGGLVQYIHNIYIVEEMSNSYDNFYYWLSQKAKIMPGNDNNKNIDDSKLPDIDDLSFELLDLDLPELQDKEISDSDFEKIMENFINRINSSNNHNATQMALANKSDNITNINNKSSDSTSISYGIDAIKGFLQNTGSSYYQSQESILKDAKFKIKLSAVGKREISIQIVRCLPLKKGGYGKGAKLPGYQEDMMPIEFTPIFNIINQSSSYYGGNFHYKPYLFILAIFQILDKVDFVVDEDENNIYIIPELLELKFEFEKQKNNDEVFDIKPVLIYQGENIISKFSIPTYNNRINTQSSDGKFFYIYNKKNGQLAFVKSSIQGDNLARLVRNELKIDKKNMQNILSKDDDYIDKLSQNTNGYIPGVELVDNLIPDFIWRMSFDMIGEYISLEPKHIYIFDNKPIQISHFDQNQSKKLIDGTIIKRNIYIEENNLTENIRMLFDAIDDFNYYKGKDESIEVGFDQDLDAFFVKIDELKELGLNVEYHDNIKKVNKKGAKINVSISSNIDRFDVNTEIEMDNMILEDDDMIREALESKQKYITLKNGEAIILSKELINNYNTLKNLDIDLRSKKTTKIHRASIAGFDDKKISLKLDQETKKLQTKLLSFDKIDNITLSKNFKATLRPYQQDGYNWLNFLCNYGFGGILADDMGLGKTIQTIAILTDVYTSKAPSEYPTLIVCPKSVIYNRYSELEKFSPKLKAKIIHNGKEGQEISNINKKNNTQIYIGSYDIVANIVNNGLNQPRHYVILDEAQWIKNPSTLRAESMCKLQAKNRLALSGTPIENNLMELWSIFNFLMPGFLATKKNFQNIYMGENTKSLSHLTEKIKPFMLRRTKEGVLKDLPPKVEEVIYLEMDDDQKKLYTQVLKTYQTSLLKDLETEGLDKVRFAVLDALLKLRQICLHPQLVKLSTNNIYTSAKLGYVRENIQDMISSGHNLLIFSQFTGFLGYVQDLLKELDISYSYLDGSCTLPKRKAAVDDFNNGKNNVFLISLKAGGSGLNLVAADYVIHLDPWRNPAVEAQATDRAHRIGQKKTVFVQKLIIKDSIEEKILQMQNEKKKLIDDVMNGDFSGSLTKDDIKNIFS